MQLSSSTHSNVRACQSVKGSGNSTFLKKINLLLEKSRKVNFLHLFFIEQIQNFLPFFVNASRSGEKLKKVPFREKKAGILNFRVKIF